MMNATNKRKCSVGLRVSEGKSPCWKSKGVVAGTAEKSHLEPQVEGREGTLG